MQFQFSFVVLALMLYFHATDKGSGCAGVWGWCFNVAFYSSLLALFSDFHAKNYGGKTAAKKLA